MPAQEIKLTDTVDKTQKKLDKILDRGTLKLSKDIIKNTPNLHILIENLSKTGLLKVELPELDALKNSPLKNIFHDESNVYEHTIRILKGIEKKKDKFTPRQFLLLRTAALLHDIGKTQDILKKDKSGRTWYKGHEIIGAKKADKILKRLGYTDKERSDVKWLIRNHMIFTRWDTMSKQEKIKLLKDPRFPILYELFKYDGKWVLFKPYVAKKIKKEYKEIIGKEL